MPSRKTPTSRSRSQSATLQAPRIDRITLPEPVDGTAADVRAGMRLDGLRLAGLALTELDLSEITMDGCALSDLVFDGTVLRGMRLLESTATHLSASAFSAPASTWRDVSVADSRFGAGEFYDAEWASVALSGCKIGYLNLRGARIRDVAMTDCVIEELDLREATALRVSLDGCRIGTLSAQHATLEHVDLRGAEIDAVDDASALRGATIASHQLQVFGPALARALGIAVA